YFKGLQDPEVLIMLMSAIKRSQIIFTVLIGGILFKEKNKKQKMIPLVGVVIGVLCIMYNA
ncbi:MAG: permease, partial [Wenyingzhuangia sp.]